MLAPLRNLHRRRDLALPGIGPCRYRRPEGHQTGVEQAQERAQQPERPLVHEWLFDISIEIDVPLDLGPIGNGHRQIVTIRGGSISGPRLQGEVLPGGSDWVLRRDGSLLLDVRSTAKTHDGNLIGVLARGYFYTSARRTQQMQEGKPAAASEQYFRSASRSKPAPSHTRGSTVPGRWEWVNFAPVW